MTGGPLSDVTNKDFTPTKPHDKTGLLKTKMSGLSLQSPAPHVISDDEYSPMKPNQQPQSSSTPSPSRAKEPMVSDYRRRELAGELKPEMLLKDNPHRYVIFPVQHCDVSGSSSGGRSSNDAGYDCHHSFVHA